MSATPGPELFGRWLDLTLSNRNVKGRELARKLGVHDSAVSRWRSGQGVPSVDTLTRMAKLLEVDPLRLVVTAGVMDGNLVGAEILPLPEPTAQRKYVKAQLNKIRGLTPAERQRLIQVFDEGMTNATD